MPDASLYELLYATYFSKTGSDGVIVMNPYGVYAARPSARKSSWTSWTYGADQILA